MTSLLKTTALAVLVGLGAMTAATAAELKIGRQNEQQSMDPLFARTGNNQMTAMHIYDRLVISLPNASSAPGLAESWKNVDPKTWNVKLRANVKFHDGSALTAKDVVYSMDRASKVPNSPATFGSSTANIAKMEIVDDLNIKFTTKEPDPNFIDNVGTIYIVNEKTTTGATSADFNGKAANGTGPYKFVSWTPGEKMELVRNDAYWGEKPAYDKVTVRYITNDAARVAALLSGAVDMIDLVPPADLAKLRQDPNIRISETASVRLIYLALNQDDKIVSMTDAAGKPLEKNPFKDARVRNAISLMIDRSTLVDRILQGQGEPAFQLVPEGVFGYTPNLKPKFDPAEAKKLLTEAGYPNGFGVTISGSNDRFLLDGEVAQALGQFLARGGIKVNKVETLPYSVFAPAAGKGSYDAFVFSLGNSTNEAGRGLMSALHTPVPGSDVGSLNRFKYSNKEFDKAAEEATAEFDEAKRQKMLGDAMAIAMKDMGFVPLYWQSVAWATRKNVSYTARRDERTLAMDAKPAQ
jgi:peptide/nickel transport system substrate-binding protein